MRDIDERLRELKQEVVRLEAARTALVGRGPGRPRGSRPTTARRRRTGSSRARRGGKTRANQALDLVRSQPGITIPQIAEDIKIEPNYLYRVLPRLEKDGLVKRDGKGWHPA